MREVKDPPLSKVHQLLEPGPVVLPTTAQNGQSNIVAMSWHMMMEFEPPLIAECFANLECRVSDTRMVNAYNLFILEVVKAWVDPVQKKPKTQHHQGYGAFAVDGETIKVRSKKP